MVPTTAPPANMPAPADTPALSTCPPWRAGPMPANSAAVPDPAAFFHDASARLRLRRRSVYRRTCTYAISDSIAVACQRWCAASGPASTLTDSAARKPGFFARPAACLKISGCRAVRPHRAACLDNTNMCQQLPSEVAGAARRGIRCWWRGAGHLAGDPRRPAASICKESAAAACRPRARRRLRRQCRQPKSWCAITNLGSPLLLLG